MKPTIRINPKSGIAYISEDIRDEGFVGEVDTLPNAITLTLIRPGSKLSDVKKSLENVLRDIELRLKYHEVEIADDSQEPKITKGGN